MPAIVAPLPQFFDLAGAPLESGFVYIGTAGGNPETAPVAVYWDAALTQPAAQPLRTTRGFVARGGTPAPVYVSGSYSLTVKQRDGVRVLYAPTSLQADNASALASDLLDATSAAKGAGLVGFADSLSYAAGTVGAWLKDLASTAGAALVGFLNTSTGLVATTVQAAIAELAARQRASVSILPNARWLVMTGHVASPKYNASGTALAGVSVSSYTTGANTVVCVTADTSSVAVGRLVSFDASAHANLRITAARVTAVVANTSFTIKLPNGLTAPSTAACIATPVEAGGSSSAGSGNGFDGWTKSSTMECWRDDWSANVKEGSKYSAGLKKGSGSAELYYVAIDARDVATITGKTISLGGWMKCPTGGSWRVFVADSVNGFRYGSTITTTGYSWSEASFAIPAAATTVSIGFELIGVSGLLFYLSQPFAGVGTVIGTPPVDLRREFIVPIVKYSPQSFTNANITFPAADDGVGTYSFTFDAYAETNGCIAPEARGLDVILEGFCASAAITGTGGRYIATRDELNVPHKYGPIMFQQVASQKIACSGFLALGDDATAYVYGLASDNWANVSMDINGVWA